MVHTVVTADSTCDLSKELLDRYGIGIIPLHVFLGDDEYRDGVDITPDAIYNWSDRNKATPKTSAIVPVEAKAFLEEHLKDAEELVYFCISAKFSSCETVMVKAAEELGVSDRVRVIDSMNLSTGIGLQVVRAAIMARSGASADAIVREMEEVRHRVRASFVVDTLTYLHRGGRCSGLAALAGSTLKLHPMIAVDDGAMHPDRKYRGRMDKVTTNYVKDLMPALEKAEPDRVFITHSGCSPELVEQVRHMLEGLHRFEEICETRAGSVVTSHCGPGTLGVLFIEGK